MNISLLHSNTYQLHTDKSMNVCVLIKKYDPVYFTEQVIVQKEISMFVFLLLLPILFVLLLLLMIISSMNILWHKFSLWLFKEKPLMSVEELQRRLKENPWAEKMSDEEKKKLLSKKDLPLGL
jgi:hypothetical protein